MAKYTVSFRVPEDLLILITGDKGNQTMILGSVSFICEPIKDERLVVIGYLGYRTVDKVGDLENLQRVLTQNSITYYTRVTK